MNRKQKEALRTRLLDAYTKDGLWGVTNPAWALPDGVVRGSDEHLAFLTLVYTISGGREPQQLWTAARQTFAEDAQLFDLQFLAYAQPKTLISRLNVHGLSKKRTSEATVWQRIGQALVMRAGGSVQKLLAEYDDDAQKLLAMLTANKATFPILSGAQTAPRWLAGLTAVAQHPLRHIEKLPVPLSPHAKRALTNLAIDTDKISALAFDAVDALGRYGCQQRKTTDVICSVADECPLARFCLYGIRP